MGHRVRVRPAFLECTACGKRRGVTLANLCDCGAPLLVRYDLESIHREDLLPRRDLWRYAPPPGRNDAAPVLTRLGVVEAGGAASGAGAGAP